MKKEKKTYLNTSKITIVKNYFDFLFLLCFNFNLFRKITLVQTKFKQKKKKDNKVVVKMKNMPRKTLKALFFLRKCSML